MTTLMITPFAPYRDGIANYAVQEVDALRRSGEDVEVMSPLPSAAHHHLVIGSATGMTRLLRRASRYERIIVQAYPELLFGACRHRIERLLVWRLWQQVAARTKVEFRVHEIDYATITADAVTQRVAASALASFHRRTVHTEPERAALLDAAPDVGAVDIVDHGAAFTRRTTLDRAGARASLGLDADAFIFLSIGFVQRHKGFDRAVRAFARIRPHTTINAQLHIVGDIRVDHPDLAAYRDELDRMIASTPGCTRRAGYVGDSEFDRWIVAADRLVLPYRSIWSSGVVERAALFDRPVIVTDVGGLADQARHGDAVVHDDRELTEAMAAALGVDVIAGVDEIPSDRGAIESLMKRHAGTVAADGVSRPSDHLLHVPPAVLGAPVSGRRGVSRIKQAIFRVTSWMTQPLADTVNDLHHATADAIDDVTARYGGDSPSVRTDDDLDE